MTSGEGQAEPGIIIRGADGGAYYIREKDLQAFRLPDPVSSAVQRALTDEVQGYGIQPFLTLPNSAGQNIQATGGTFLFASNSATIRVVDFGAVSG